MLAHDALRLFFLLAQRFADGLQQLLDGHFTCLERSTGRRLIAAEYFARQLEKGFAVGVERHARGTLDGGAHLRLALGQQFCGAGALLLVAGNAGTGCLEFRAQVFRAARRAQCAGEIADDRSCQGRDHDPGDIHAAPFPGRSSQVMRSSGVSSQPC